MMSPVSPKPLPDIFNQLNPKQKVIVQKELAQRNAEIKKYNERIAEKQNAGDPCVGWFREGPWSPLVHRQAIVGKLEH